MAAEPSNARTMTTLMLRVAEKLGVGEYRSAGQIHVPVNQYNFNLCKQYIQNGITMLMADAPRRGWRWMRRLASVTFATRVTGTVDSVSGTAPGAYTLVDATLVDTYDTDDDLKNWWIYILTGTGIGRYAQITGYAKATGTCTVADWLDVDGNPIAYSGGAVPAATDTFAITSVRTSGGDAARYILPANFGGTIDGPIEYAAGSNRSTFIEWCDESRIRIYRTPTVISGPPRKAAIRPYQPIGETLGQTRLWEIIFDPQPISADTVEFPYTLFFDSMDMESGIATTGNDTTLTDDTRTEAADYFVGWTIEIVDGVNVGKSRTVTAYTAAGQFTFATMTTNNTTTSEYIVYPPNNLHPAGHQHDDVIEAACLARTEMESQDEHMDTFWTDYYHKKALRNAYTIDARSAPRKLGKMLNRPGALRRGRSWNDTEFGITSPNY